MLSLRPYWLVLTVIFTGFALLTWFVLIPYGIVEYNLGVNLFTSSIFMVIGIVLLTWMFKLIEEREWNCVKEKVFQRIALNLRSIISLITYFVNMSDMRRLENIKKSRTKITENELLTARLEDLNEKVELVIDEKGKSILLNSAYIIDFEVRRRLLSEIEMKYSKFLTPSLTISLMEIQNSLIELHFKVERLRFFGTRTEYSQLREVYLRLISELFKRIIKEIYKIHKMEIYPK